jgi:pimeloyl-ACP methyl ester carboxylesterase
MSHPIVEHRLQLDGVETRALDLDGAGPRILLFHGFGDSADTWRLVLDRLRREGRAATALDMPGFGTASRLDREEAILPQLDRFVAAAVRHFADGRGVIVAGNSLGGCQAIRAAQDPSLSIQGIVPVAPAGLDMASWIRIIEGAPVLRAVLGSPLPVPEPIVRRAVGRMFSVFAFAHPRRVDPALIAAFAAHVPTKRDASRILATGKRVAGELRECFELEKITCPVLMVWGDRDRMVYASGADRVLREVEGSRLEMIEDCGHCPQLEEPDRLTELLLGFPQAEVGVTAPAEISAA